MRIHLVQAQSMSVTRVVLLFLHHIHSASLKLLLIICFENKVQFWEMQYIYFEIRKNSLYFFSKISLKSMFINKAQFKKWHRNKPDFSVI